MDPVLKKMNFKNQPEICVLNAPESFEPNLEARQSRVRRNHDPKLCHNKRR